MSAVGVVARLRDEGLVVVRARFGGPAAGAPPGRSGPGTRGPSFPIGVRTTSMRWLRPGARRRGLYATTAGVPSDADARRGDAASPTLVGQLDASGEARRAPIGSSSYRSSARSSPAALERTSTTRGSIRGLRTFMRPCLSPRKSSLLLWDRLRVCWTRQDRWPVPNRRAAAACR